jgi:UDP-N-acetylglucosamine 2-epimerase (non-hydrolysing)
MKIIVVAGARPNFMKVAPILAQLRRYPDAFTPLLVHTGQHYDYRMSDVFFRDLGLPDPDHYLEARADGGVGKQVADIIAKFDDVLQREQPQLVLVVGDVSSTLACTIAAAARQVPVAHVEAGLRSGDRTMPEELNRVATDGLADMLFTYSADADAHLRAENVPDASIFRVGNVMIDTLLRLREKAAKSTLLSELGLEPKGYALATLHRPANVDIAEALRGFLEAFSRIQQQIPLVFQIHPRTRKKIETFGLEPLLESMKNLHLLEPTGYVDFLHLQENARLALVDSGGIQEETTVLGVPCLTLRDNTERPVTIEHGTNQLIGRDPDKIVAAALELLDGKDMPARVPELWDGHSAERLVEVLSRGVVRRV